MHAEYLVLEFISLVLVVDSDGEYRHFRQVRPFRLVHLGEPLFLCELRWHVVYIFHPYRCCPGPWKEETRTCRNIASHWTEYRPPRGTLKICKTVARSRPKTLVVVLSTWRHAIPTFLQIANEYFKRNMANKGQRVSIAGHISLKAHIKLRII